MEQTITTRDLVDRLSEVLDRVRNRNERFIVEQQGVPVASLIPVGPQLGVKFYDALDALSDLKMPGDRFADDLEAVQAAEPQARFPEWPS